MNDKTEGAKRIPILIGITIVLTILSIGSAYAERGMENSQIKNKINTISGINTVDLNQGFTPTDLVNNLLGGGVTVSNVKFTGSNVSAGTFTGGTDIIGFDGGIILSSGDIKNVIGPNVMDGISQANGVLGDPDLDKLIPGYSTHDAAVLEFDFVPVTNQLQFKYVFGSDEYNYFVNSQYNDVFGFFVNGNNVALIPGTNTPVSINNVNCGNPFDGANNCAAGKNPGYYRNNDIGSVSIYTEMDGLTTVLTATANVNAGKTNHIKLAIADAGDYVLDSHVLIQAGSFESPQLKLNPATATNTIGTSHTLTATLVDGGGKPISGQTITFNVTNGPHSGTTGSGTTDSNGVATWSYVGTNVGTDTIIAYGYDQISIPVYKIWEQLPLPTISLTPATATNNIGTSHTLTATLVDANGKPMSGHKITFNVTSGPHVGMSGNNTTNSAGIATWSYVGTNVGTDNIIAMNYDQNGNIWTTSNDAQKTWIQASLPTLSLSPTTATNNVGISHTLTATLVDGSGNPMSGQTITFTVTAGPHSGTTGSGTTNSAGVATWSYVGKTVGTDTIVATGAEQTSNSVEKIWKQVSLSTINLSPATATNIVGTSHTVTATVDNGTPQPGVTVSFNIISGPNSPLSDSGVTDSKGQTTFTYIGNGGVGIDNIQASIIVNGAEILSNTVEKEWVSSSDIMAYYRGLNQYPDIVETNDLLKAADDWRDNIMPPQFAVSLNTNQLLTLADEWRNS